MFPQIIRGLPAPLSVSMRGSENIFAEVTAHISAFCITNISSPYKSVRTLSLREAYFGPATCTVSVSLSLQINTNFYSCPLLYGQ